MKVDRSRTIGVERPRRLWSHALVAATTGDLIAAFVGSPLAGPGDPMAQVLARQPTVRREQGNAAGGAGGG